MTYLLEAAETHARAAGASKVLAINLCIGARAGLVDDSLAFYFEMLSPDTLLQGAQLNVRRTAMRFSCGRCEADYAPSGFDFQCPTCGEVGQLADDGSQMLIESIEIET